MNETTRLTKAFLMLPLLLLITLATGTPVEAMGRVSKVVDGDTFNLSIPVIALLITLVTFFIALVGIVYQFGRKLGELEGIKKVIESKMESLDQKYITSGKIEKVELDIERLSTESKAENEVVREHIYQINNILSDNSIAFKARCEKSESRIKSFEDEMKAHKEHHPPAYKSSID
jgi:hypothetical protein